MDKLKLVCNLFWRTPIIFFKMNNITNYVSYSIFMVLFLSVFNHALLLHFFISIIFNGKFTN